MRSDLENARVALILGLVAVRRKKYVLMKLSHLDIIFPLWYCTALIDLVDL
jgi:hypothetical protein